LVKENIEMVKKYFLVIVLSILLFAGNSFAATFTWENVNPVCYGTCSSYIIVWKAVDYATACPQDVLEEATDCNVDPVGCTKHFIPSTCYVGLKEIITIKIKVLPESYDTTEFTIRKSDAPMLEDDSQYVSVVTAYEIINGREFESDFSNRVVWKTPITIEPFDLRVE